MIHQRLTLSVSKIRDDKVILVDKSNQALAIARQKALELGVEASFINCDIEQTSDHVARSEDSVVYTVEKGDTLGKIAKKLLLVECKMLSMK